MTKWGGSGRLLIRGADTVAGSFRCGGHPDGAAFQASVRG